MSVGQIPAREDGDSTKRYYFSCPKCGNSERFLRVAEERRGGLSLLLLLTGHLLFALMASQHNRKRVQCRNCMFVFAPPLPESRGYKIAKVAVALLSILGAAVIVLALVATDPFLLHSCPSLAYSLGLFWASPHVGLLFVGLSILAVAAAVLALGGVSNLLHWHRLSRSYLMKPEDPA
jgi:hypothetical protein